MNEKKLSDQELTAIIQGLLFIAGTEGLSLEALATYLNLAKKKTKVEALISQLQDKLEADEGSGLSVIKLGDLYKLTTKIKHHQFYQVLQEQPITRLSQAALETLAIIAYNQPVTKTKIEEIRGVNCDGIVSKLKSLNFISEAGRTELPGRPFLYVITNEFMDHFQLESLAQLPELPNFSFEEEQEIYNYSDENK
ncbi:SMC-Scp complex subunit ScpB [Spiroplasma platyhelix]|uniref:Segregation and condensation protein B n=1 Tax=Spiroplasma platyhelix PALS-1 TaxID=1276218 RepID=A0A846TZT1_9MOLU|nr:SMC-Scp complex subunit ScpB [Spiroplasma platyhelix]MBE4703911.1 Segregation and condensation protein B [Spiroplasma platyhelix PALS-1]NKE38284.1 SMC-Scp complex subunit ScpB [Spiroplasma platyhelix PALS-1]UJB29169.1 chromosome condensation and segregation factor B [Spiroplasma platyhelix PALS-1]